MELIALLGNVEMFDGLSRRELKKLAAVFIERGLEAGEVLFWQGDKADRLHLVKSGFVEVVVSSSAGADERVVAILGPGQSVGEMSLLDRGARSGTVRAVTAETVIASVSFEDFWTLCRKNPRLGQRVMRNIATDLSFRLRRRDVGR